MALSSEKILQDYILHYYFPRGKKIASTNFSGQGFGECDVIDISPTGIVTEYEVKCSRADFKNDFKKAHKHGRLKGLGFQLWKGVPNRFYFVCPEGLLDVSLIPNYAGLIYINTQANLGEGVLVIKKAPLLHREKATEELLKTIAQNLTAKLIYGCSYMRHKQKQYEQQRQG